MRGRLAPRSTQALQGRHASQEDPSCGLVRRRPFWASRSLLHFGKWRVWQRHPLLSRPSSQPACCQLQQRLQGVSPRVSWREDCTRVCQEDQNAKTERWRTHWPEDPAESRNSGQGHHLTSTSGLETQKLLDLTMRQNSKVSLFVAGTTSTLKEKYLLFPIL